MKLIVLFIILICTTILSMEYLSFQGDALAQRTNGIKAIHDCVHENTYSLQAYSEAYNWMLLIFVSPLFIYYGSYDFQAFIKSFLHIFFPLMIFRCFTTTITIPTRTTDHQS